MENNIKLEAKNITYLSKNDIGEDIHIVKEIIHHPDGKKEDNIKIIKDFKRPIWITKEIYRKHTDKKESEDLKRVDMYLSTESNLGKTIASRLGSRYVGITDLWSLRDSPYVYGLDVDSRTFLKHKYLEKYDIVTPYRVGTFDIEVNVLTNEIILCTLATRDIIYTYALKSFVKSINNIEQRVTEAYEKYIPENSFNPKLEFKVFDNEVDMIKTIFYKANYANIDFLAIWNIAYDIPKIVERLEHFGVNPEDIFHYDKIPNEYKYFKFKEARKQRVTESGVVKPINPEEQWHTVKSSTNYYFIDAMSSHRYVRVGGKNVPGGYSLDNILKHEGVAKKLKFDEDQGIHGIEWHIHMVKNRPVEYIIYNIWDALSMLELDNKTKDLEVAVPLLSGISHFDIFNSGPKKIVDRMTFFYLSKGRILGTKPRKLDDDKLLGLSNWIIMLSTYRIKDNGLKIIDENTNLSTYIHGLIYDNDVSSAYPSATRACNVSRDTTHREIRAIGDIDKEVFKKQNINLMYGPTNAIEYCNTMFNFPDLMELEKLIKQKI